MTIDVHTHLAFKDIYPMPYLAGMLENGNNRLSNEEFSSLISFFLNDKFCKKLISQMDTAGISKSVLLIIDGGIRMGEPVLSLEEIYQLHYEMLKLYPERFLVFAGIDPRRGSDGFKLFEKGIYEYGFKGVKLYPPMGYAMDDERLWDYYKVCDDNHLAVLIHTGPSLPSLQNDLAHPREIYHVARQFPNINFILAHAGINPTVLLETGLIELPNVFADIAGFQSMYSVVDESMINALGLIFSEKYNSKILFGSDWPLFNIISPIKKHVHLITELFEKVEDKTSDGLKNVLYKNAKRVLRIDS